MRFILGAPEITAVFKYVEPLLDRWGMGRWVDDGDIPLKAAVSTYQGGANELCKDGLDLTTTEFENPSD